MLIRLLIILTLLALELSALNVEYFYDKNSTLSFTQIQSVDFKKSKNPFTYGYKEGDAWFKIEIENVYDSEELILYFSEPLWEKFDFYSLDNGEVTVFNAGLLVSLEKRQILDVNPAFVLNIPLYSSKTYYINAKTVSGQLGEFQVKTAKEYYSPTHFSLTGKYLLFLSMLLVVLILNLYLFIRRRERIYGYYVAYLASFMAWIAILSGIYLIFGFNGWNEGLHASGTFVVLFLALFSAEYLELKERRDKLNLVFNLFIVSFILLAILITLKIPYATPIFNIFASVFFTLLLIVAIKVYQEGHLKMRYYLVALIVYMPTMMIMTLNFNNIIANNDITRYAYVFGSMAEILFFNSLMITRYSEAATEANVDVLSNLYNRRYFQSYSQKSFSEMRNNGEKFSILMIDIDNFKIVNDTYGHAVGDEVIKKCAEIMSKLTRLDDIVARYGGEEFIVMMKNSQAPSVLDVANRIRETIASSGLILKNEERVSFTISLGISHLEFSDEDIEMVIQRADKALYQAKAEGKNKVVVF